jgi:hypothetical protein
MAEEKMNGRETWRQALPWTMLFRGFQVALDLNKLVLAAAGILVMAFGWWLLSVIFGAGFSRQAPEWPSTYKQQYGDQAWVHFKQDRENWNLMNEAANLAGAGQTVQPIDIAVTRDLSEEQYLVIQKAYDEAGSPVGLESRLAELVKVKESNLSPELAAVVLNSVGQPKRVGTLSTWPWNEDRGPNPFLLATGQAGIPWQPGHFWDWFSRDQVFVLTEPLVKFMRPLVYFFSPRADGLLRFYFFCVLMWTLGTWALFGGAITRIAAVQVARNGEKIGMSEALRFTGKRLLSYVLAPFFPLLFIFVLLVFMIVYGWVGMIPVFGDVFVFGLFWPLMLVFGLIMAVSLVGLIGWPLMSATISTEGTDSWEAVSRSYSYVYQRPWHYLWYGAVAIVYGAAVVFFVGFMGSLLVYLSKWGVAQTPGIDKADRNPAFLFAYAPASWDWRGLLLEGARVNGHNVVEDQPIGSGVRRTPAGGVNRWNRINYNAYNEYLGTFKWYNTIGAGVVTFWLGILFLLILGFGYSYFWTASTIIYLLLRHSVDAHEMDEVYLEEEDHEGPLGLGLPTPPAPAPSAKPGSQSLPMVEAPVRAPAPSAAVTHPAPVTTLAPAPVVEAPAHEPEPVRQPEPPVSPVVGGAGVTSTPAPSELPPSSPPPSGDGNQTPS